MLAHKENVFKLFAITII